MPTWNLIDTSETSDWSVIKTDTVRIRDASIATFAGGAFASGPFAGLGITYQVENWEEINTYAPTSWQVIQT